MILMYNDIVNTMPSPVTMTLSFPCKVVNNYYCFSQSVCHSACLMFMLESRKFNCDTFEQRQPKGQTCEYPILGATRRRARFGKQKKSTLQTVTGVCGQPFSPIFPTFP